MAFSTLVPSPATAQLIEPRIVGTWEWISTQIEGQPTITPGTSGHTEQWEFTLSSEYRRYRNGHRQFQATFLDAEILLEERFRLLLWINGQGGDELRHVDATTLVLVDTDGPSFDNWTFQRRGPVPTSTRTLGELKQTYAN